MNREELLSKVWYLAHPYSGNEEDNFRKVNKIGSDLFRHGVIFFSPISMSHPIHLVEEDHSSWKQWMRFDKWFRKYVKDFTEGINNNTELDAKIKRASFLANLQQHVLRDCMVEGRYHQGQALAELNVRLAHQKNQLKEAPFCRM